MPLMMMVVMHTIVIIHDNLLISNIIMLLHCYDISSIHDISCYDTSITSPYPPWYAAVIESYYVVTTSMIE